mgnify:CR=1 FL=1
MTAAATWLAVTDSTRDTTVAVGVSVGAGVAYALASCMIHNFVGLVLFGAVLFQWATGQWLTGLAGAAMGVGVAVWIVKRYGNVDYWLEFVWVTVTTSLFGPGLAVYALIQLRWPARLDAWLLLAALPWMGFAFIAGPQAVLGILFGDQITAQVAAWLLGIGLALLVNTVLLARWQEVRGVRLVAVDRDHLWRRPAA